MNSIAAIKAELKPIKTKEEYQSYLKIIDSLIDCAEERPEEQVLELCFYSCGGLRKQTL